MRTLLNLLPYIEPSMSREKRLALIETLGSSLDMLLMLRASSEGNSARAKKLYLNLLQMFSKDGYAYSRSASQYIAMRGGYSPYTLDHCHGFTLIELSIVLVIIGLIVGGILVGRDLIHAAEIRSAVSQIERYNATVNTFSGKYNCLPGDCTLAQAQQFGLTVTDVTGNNACVYPGDGNGYIGISSFDGIIANTAPGACGLTEVSMFWQHLKDAHMLVDPIITLNGASVGNNGGVAVKFSNVAPSPAAATGNTNTTGGITIAPAILMASGNFFSNLGMTTQALERLGNSGNHVFLFSASIEGHSAAASLLPLDAFALDQKMDDGLPESGATVAGGDEALQTPSAGPKAALNCINTDSAPHSYNTSVTNPTAGSDSACSLIVKAAF